MLQFSKYQGLGNDFLLIDARAGTLPAGVIDPEPAWVRDVCDRRFGVGGDGLILVLPPRDAGEVRMRIFNADGSEAEMCGNGIRCLARYLADGDGELAAPGAVRRWTVETGAGLLTPQLLPDGTIEVDMGAPRRDPAGVPTTAAVGAAGLPEVSVSLDGTPHRGLAVGMGNPHLVIPVTDVEALPLETLGPELEHHPAFPARTNVHLVQVLAPDHLRMRVWERGAGPTPACGTGACATLVALHCLGACEATATVELPGGPLRISWAGGNAPVLMRGPAEAVFDGVLTPELTPAWERTAAAEDRDAGGIDCASECMEGCRRPENCPSAAARASALSFLDGHSLDEMISLASDSLEARTQARLTRDGDATP
jgi:diaminopimelate epimerase